jgi:hypothetical protein
MWGIKGENRRHFTGRTIKGNIIDSIMDEYFMANRATMLSNWMLKTK